MSRCVCVSGLDGPRFLVVRMFLTDGTGPLERGDRSGHSDMSERGATLGA